LTVVLTKYHFFRNEAINTSLSAGKVPGKNLGFCSIEKIVNLCETRLLVVFCCAVFKRESRNYYSAS